ncbi:DNA repair and recombination protein RAD54, putative [Bodo saltans]|uniref:DNA repair and recombination protein RAD54, putative n=1 Tax=Bodo saltans TaxID=75058 RepID=A0A0S4J0Y9_BODSA|nr:DNA repair and recombination protein RAD54, putative [Bodo saltans]|eukprot:CUG78612.1 DNA repair and recombination protein RAD54, putative [Bodo saltans]
MLCAGTIEEKIYQRQVSKQGLSANVVDMKDDSKQHFSTEELKQLFAYRPDSLSDTHDLLQCDCQAAAASSSSKAQPQPQVELKFRKVGVPVTAKAATGGPRMDELRSWMHISDVAKFALDKVISKMATRDKRLISFAFANERDAKKYAATEEVAVDRAFVKDEGNITCCSQTRDGDGADEDEIEIVQDASSDFEEE